MVDSYEERKRLARIELIKRRYRERQAPKVNKDINIRQGNQQTITVNKMLKWRTGNGYYDKGTIEDIHNEIQRHREHMEEEEGSWWKWEEDMADEIDYTDYLYTVDNPLLTDLQKRFGRRVMEYEEAKERGDTNLSRDDYMENPLYKGRLRLPENLNSASKYNIALHWQNDDNLPKIANEIADVLGININNFYQDMGENGVGEVQATHLRKLIPAFLAQDTYFYDGHSQYYKKILTDLQANRWSKIGNMWAAIFNGDEIPRSYDVEDLMAVCNGVSAMMNKMPGLETDTVFIRYGSLLSESDLEVGDISNFAGFAFSGYNADNNFGSYQRGRHADSKRYKITILAPKGVKGISGGVQSYIDMRFKDNTTTGEFIHDLNQKFIMLSIDKVEREALVLLIDDGMANKWLYRK